MAAITPTLLPNLFAFDLFSMAGTPLTHLSNHRLSGTVKTNGAISADKRVSVLAQGTLKILDSTMSQADGSWEIRGLPAFYDGLPLTVIVTDEADAYNAEIADNVLAVGIGELK